MSNESKSVAVPEENIMGVMPVGRLLFSMSLPMMLSMLVQALYNIVDSIFVAKLSEDALSAVSLAFPLQTLIFAVGGGTCVGVNALLSRALGEKDFKKANDVAMNGAFNPWSYGSKTILCRTVKWDKFSDLWNGR